MTHHVARVGMGKLFNKFGAVAVPRFSSPWQVIWTRLIF